MAAQISLALPRKSTSAALRGDLGDRVFVVGGKLLWLGLLGVAVLLPLLAIFWRGFSSEAGQGGDADLAEEAQASTD